MQELKQMWQSVRAKLENLVSVVSYDLWIEPIEPVDYVENKLVLCANSATAKNQILKNHIGQLKECVDSVFGSNIDVKILDPNEKEAYIEANRPQKNQAVEENAQPETKGHFNEKYTFDNFVVGKSNQTCYTAARAVAENPGKLMNPLFIWGGVGLGKTHLLHAIGNYICQNNPKIKIEYVTCEKFTNDYIESLSGANKEKGTTRFREKYRNLDVLMVDDIQFISKKTSTQEEFFHTFNELYQSNKQIIISSDRPPKEIETLEERLSSRFASGLMLDIQSPDFETRVAILRKKSQLEHYFMDDEVINFIADKMDTNIREMEGMLSKVHFYSLILGKKVATISDAEDALRDQINMEKERLTPESIVHSVCDYFNIEYNEIIGKKKSKEIVEPRMIAIYLINDLLDVPLITIGKLFGGRDHTTIMHSRDKITELMKSDQKTKLIVSDIKKKINEKC